MPASEIQALGTGIASLMSTAQLEAAVLLYSSIVTATADQNTVSIHHIRTAFFSHLKACIRMPAGGANAGGSQQTGFEMDLISVIGITRLMDGWPNHQLSEQGRRHSWELRTMEELAEHLELEIATDWGVLMGRPMPLTSRRTEHAGVLLISPPFTVSWGMRPNGTTWLCVRFPILLWSEEDAIVLPPDDAQGTPFYVDPPNQPGLHRDLFKTWARRVAGELTLKGFPMSRALRQHLPAEYLSDSEAGGGAFVWDGSDSSDAPGAHK